MQKESRFIAWVWIAIIFTQGIGLSQTVEEDSSKSRAAKSLISTIADDFLHVVSSPRRMSKSDALRFTSFLALNVALIYGVDAEADEEFALEGHKAYMKPAEALAEVGDLYDRIGTARVIAGLTTTMLAGGIIFKDKKLLNTVGLMIESSIITGVITSLSKGLFGRSRPYTERGAQAFNLFKFSLGREYLSFPSGHSSSAFAMMTVIAKQYDQWWIKYPAYTLAVSVALQRMEARQHWASDVVVGGVIGYCVSSTLVSRHRGKTNNQPLIPYFAANQIGVRIYF